MNKLEDALKDIQNFLKVRGVPYMIIGGIGNLVWGEPRMTVDIDIHPAWRGFNYKIARNKDAVVSKENYLNEPEIKKKA